MAKKTDADVMDEDSGTAGQSSCVLCKPAESKLLPTFIPRLATTEKTFVPVQDLTQDVQLSVRKPVVQQTNILES